MGKYRIIALDGGGLKGLLSLGMMERISAKLGEDEWIGKADMYAGTSTGGLIALGLAAGKTIGDIRAFYEKEGPAIFDRRTWTYVSSLGKTLHVGYENTRLDGSLRDLLGEVRLPELTKDVVVVAFDLKAKPDKRFSWAPKIFHNVEGKGQDQDLAREVGLYTSAAPTFLPSVEGFVDGGVCANNPAMCALAQVLDPRSLERHELRDIVLLSIGTGVNPEALTERTIRWGIFGWNIKLLRIIMDGSVGIADYQCRQLLTEERYRRLQVDLGQDLDMDDASKLPAMAEIVAGIDDKIVEDWADWVRDAWLKYP